MKKKTMLELGRITCDEYKKSEKIPLIVVLDDVRSMQNVGSIFRTADAFLIEEIVLCGITAVPPHPDIHKSALGAEESVDFTYKNDIMEAIDYLRCKGCKICAIEQVQGSVSIEQFIINTGEKYAVILGNEVKGVHQQAVDASDVCIELPQYGTKHSLNVSITAGIVMWKFFEKMKLSIKL